jgi:surface antigen
MSPAGKRASSLRVPAVVVSLLVLAAACADSETVRLELKSAQERARVGFGDRGEPQEEAALRAAELPAAARRYRVGDRFLYSDETVYEVVEVDGQIVAFDDGNGRYRVASFNPVFPDWRLDSRRYVRIAEIGGDEPAGLWPLGGQPRQAYNVVVLRTDRETSETRRFGSRLECDSPAPVTVEGPLGAYAAVPVTCRYFSGRRLNQTRVRRYDMVPELGHWVRYVETELDGEVRIQRELVGIEPGPWLEPAVRQRLGERLRTVLETRPSGEPVAFTDASGLEGLIMATGTFTDPVEIDRLCRSYTLTIADGDGTATDYPGRSCRTAQGWSLPDGF